MSFKWTPKRRAVALALAEGHTIEEASRLARVTERTIYNWKRKLEFEVEIDRLSLMTDIASRAERLRIAMQVARQKVCEDGNFDTNKDLLDWLKFAQSETDGAKLDLAAIFDAMEATAGSTETGNPNEPEPTAGD